VSLGHLLYERALAQPTSPSIQASVSGRSFTITDPNPPVAARSIYRLLNVLAGVRVMNLPFVLMLILCHVMEAYVLFVSYFTRLAQLCGFKEPSGVAANLQPSIMVTVGVQQFADSAEAELPVEEGGLGFRGVCTTIEGMADQVRKFQESGGETGKSGVTAGVPTIK
jgi:hypothetical protein